MEIKTVKQLFQHVWNTRPHVSEISGEPLHDEGHWQWHWQFAHVLGKGNYPRYKLNPDNIMLMLPKEHEQQEQYEKFNERRLQLKAKYFRGE